MGKLRRVLLALTIVTGLSHAGAATATAAEAAETHDCVFIIIMVPCSYPEGEWMWICETYHGGIEYHNACRIPRAED